MDTKSRWWLGFFVIIIVIVAGYRYQQYIVERNFLLEANTVCDPTTDSCFVMDCLPEEDPFCDITPYKKIEILASDAPQCLEEHTCESFSCGDTEGCTETFCSEDTREEWELCAEINSELPQASEDIETRGIEVVPNFEVF